MNLDSTLENMHLDEAVCNYLCIFPVFYLQLTFVIQCTFIRQLTSLDKLH